jgi:hypothetical protein
LYQASATFADPDVPSITWSHWVDGALDDIHKTFRIFYRCDDIWVLQDGAWKMQYSKVFNMGYGAEAPYYGKKN